MDEWCNSLWSLNEQELRKKRKTLEAGLEKLLHTERLEFTALLFTRLQEIILSTTAPNRRSATKKKQNYIQ